MLQVNRSPTGMNATKQSRFKLDISYVRGVWEVGIFIGDQTEHRSFRTESQAREYGAARIEQFRLEKTRSEIDGATSRSRAADRPSQ